MQLGDKKKTRKLYSQFTQIFSSYFSIIFFSVDPYAYEAQIKTIWMTIMMNPKQKAIKIKQMKKKEATTSDNTYVVI